MKLSTIIILPIIAVLLLSGNAKSQDFERKSLITFKQFTEKVSVLKIQGFSGKPQFESDDDEGEYSAYFIQGGESVVIKLEARHYPPAWTTGRYKLDGKDAEYGSLPNMGILTVDLPDTYSILNIGSTRIRDKAALEQIARQTGLMQITPVSAAWPVQIPDAYRLSGVLLETSAGSGSDADGFSNQISVTLIMSRQLKYSLIEMAEKYTDEGDFLRFPNGMILNYPFSEIESIDEMYRDNDELTFIYYIP